VLFVNSVIELVNVPVPVPFDDLLSVIVGFCKVLQQTPLAVTVAFPSLVTFPPLVAKVAFIPEIAVVVTVGAVVDGFTGSSVFSYNL